MTFETQSLTVLELTNQNKLTFHRDMPISASSCWDYKNIPPDLEFYKVWVLEIKLSFFCLLSKSFY